MNRIYVIEIMKCVQQGKGSSLSERDVWSKAGNPSIHSTEYVEFTDSMDSNPLFKSSITTPTRSSWWNVWTYVGGTSNDK